MRHWVLLLLLAVTVAVIAYLVVWVFTGNDNGLDPEEPDGRAVPLPGARPLVESDISTLRFDTVARGYRMVQVDAALRRAAYDVGYKQELIDVLEAEVIALRDGRMDDAEALRQARDGSLSGSGTTVITTSASGSSRDEAAVERAIDGRADLGADHDAATDHDAGTDRAVGTDHDVRTDQDGATDQDARADRDSDRVGGVERSDAVADGVTAKSDRDPVAEPDLGQRNGAVDRSDHDDQTLGDRAATGR
jgi:DivIVA domain-containing protein